MRLCLALGIEDPEEWLDSSAPRKVALWEAYGELEPFGEERADLRNGTLITALDRFFLGDKSEARPEQFILKFHGKKKKPKRKVQTAEDQLSAFSSIMEFHAAAMRGNHGGSG